MNHSQDKPDTPIAQRKAQLIAEGAAYRSGIGNATQSVKTSLRAESVAKSAIGYLATIGFSLLKGRSGLGGLGLQTALPLLISGVSTLSKKPALKPFLRSALILGTLGAAVGFLIKKKKTGASTKSAKTRDS